MLRLTQCSRLPWFAYAGVLLVAAVFGGVLGEGLAAADGVAPRAEDLYAAFTINLTRFITWPESALGPEGTPFLIGSFTRDPINPHLDAAAQGESIEGHPIRTVRLRSAADAQKCHVVFVSRGAADLASLVVRLRHRPVLLVSNADNVLSAGGHVHFSPGRSQVRLQISATNLRDSGLEARAQLLRLAEQQ